MGERAGHDGPLAIVLAKAPLPGFAKTRLCPPCSPQAAAQLAHAALLDTLSAVEAWGGRSLLALDRCGTQFQVDCWDTVDQSDGPLGSRLDHVFSATFAANPPPTSLFLVGMDTPQLQVDHLTDAFSALEHHDVALGPATDGGYWGIGFNAHVPGAFDGVPMSTDRTFEHQYARLCLLGCSVAVLSELSDIDTFPDAMRVGAAHPCTRVGQLTRVPNWWDTTSTS